MFALLSIVAIVVEARFEINQTDWAINCTDWNFENAVILSGGDRLSRGWKTLRENRVQTANESGWAYCECTGRIDASRPFVWNKILYLKYALIELKFESALWIDADAYFARPTTTLQSLLWPIGLNEIDCILSHDLPSENPGFLSINAGVMWFRNTPWSLNALEAIYIDGFTETKHMPQIYGDREEQSGVIWFLEHHVSRTEILTSAHLQDQRANDTKTTCVIFEYGVLQVFPQKTRINRSSWIHQYAGADVPVPRRRKVEYVAEMLSKQ